MESPRRKRDRDSMRKLFEEKRHIGGRLPDIIQPPSSSPPEAAAPSTHPPAASDDQEESQVTTQGVKGRRINKITGLQLVLQGIWLSGFAHPSASKGFLMIPREFKALLSLETQAVVQIVFEVLEKTVGWEDAAGLFGRREWAQISATDFERECGINRAQVQRGLKRALNQGYIRRRPKMNGFEYAIRWRDEDIDQG